MNNTMVNEALAERTAFIIPKVSDSKFSSAELADDMDGLQLSFQRAKIPGGGAAYLRISPAVAAYCRTLSGDRRLGAEAVLRALEEPARRIAANGGLDPDGAVAGIRAGGFGTVLDVMSGQYADMEASGILDAARVVRVALESAVSLAAVLLTVETGVGEHVCTL